MIRIVTHPALAAALLLLGAAIVAGNAVAEPPSLQAVGGIFPDVRRAVPLTRLEARAPKLCSSSVIAFDMDRLGHAAPVIEREQQAQVAQFRAMPDAVVQAHP
jgi:hypothetical protein